MGAQSWEPAEDGVGQSGQPEKKSKVGAGSKLNWIMAMGSLGQNRGIPLILE